MKGGLLVALGVFVTWYGVRGGFNRSGDSDAYFPLLLLGGIVSVAYGTFLLLSIYG